MYAIRSYYVAGDIIYVTITDGNGCQSTCEVTPNLYDCTPNCETAFSVKSYNFV